MSTFDRIRQEPQFQQIRQIIRTNPHLLEQFIQQMSRENPELFRVRLEHPSIGTIIQFIGYYCTPRRIYSNAK